MLTCSRLLWGHNRLQRQYLLGWSKCAPCLTCRPKFMLHITRLVSCACRESFQVQSHQASTHLPKLRTDTLRPVRPSLRYSMLLVIWQRVTTLML